MASLTRWTWVSVNSASWWWTGRSGVLRFMGSQRVGHDWATDLIWSDLLLKSSSPVFCDFLMSRGSLTRFGTGVWQKQVLPRAPASQPWERAVLLSLFCWNVLRWELARLHLFSENCVQKKVGGALETQLRLRSGGFRTFWIRVFRCSVFFPQGWCWVGLVLGWTPPRSARFVVAQQCVVRMSLETAVETSRVYWTGNLSSLRQSSWVDTPLCMADSRQDLQSSVHSGGRRSYLLEEEWMLVGLSVSRETIRGARPLLTLW